ncbi:hypothetical protein LTR64_008686 [Lithohypha guttulata]|uniref:uncharacterized protein n=1 Tax=Lithohypha guttulata TaxID=1690604 RepID=UPI002DDFA257|nr:hypothetical protein LTR51_008708 [Lithohypha guttulata]
MSDFPNSNERHYTSPAEAFALRRSSDKTSLSFDYSVLDTTAPDTNSSKSGKDKDAGDILDSQRWLENPKVLEFSSELRAVGEEAVPVYVLQAFDRSDRPLKTVETTRADPYRSTSLCLMNPDTSHFEVTSDGKYVYLFRQSRAASDSYLNRFVTTSTIVKPPIDSNLLCDRFTLVGTSLLRTLEVRYRRSRQKRFPLNEKDTLAVRDIDDIPFYEPTFSLIFVKDMQDGRFSVLQTPTMTNGVFKWMIFAYSVKVQDIVCFTTDVAIDGLFDVHGQIYYTCDNEEHEETFSTTPGACSATTDDGRLCENVKTVVVPAPVSSQCSLLFLAHHNQAAQKSVGSETADKQEYENELKLDKPIDLSALPFSEGYTLEAWIRPLSTKGKSDAGESDKASDAVQLPAGSKRELFSLAPGQKQTEVIGKDVVKQQKFINVSINDKNQIFVYIDGADQALAQSEALETGAWHHVAITFASGSPSKLTLIVNGGSSAASTVDLGPTLRPGYLETLISQLDPTKPRFEGNVDEVRLWSLPLKPATVKSQMYTRTCGNEPYLEACWHLDEGKGSDILNCSQNAHHTRITGKSNPESADIIWSMAAAPLLEASGLSQRVIRLKGIDVAGGLHAAVYFEQVTVTQSETASTEPSATQKSTGIAAETLQKSDHKPEEARSKNKHPMKREARVLLCFVAKKASDPGTALATLDFGVMSNGTLADWPAIIECPDVVVTGEKKKYAPIPLIWSDNLGMDLFGGYLNIKAARCGIQAPQVWDSATGTVTIFYQSRSDSDNSVSHSNKGKFSALIYDISRAIKTTSLQSFFPHSNVQVACKLRQADNVNIHVEQSLIAPKTVAVNLTISAKTSRGLVEETWENVPSNINRLADLLSGRISNTKTKVGELAEVLTEVKAENSTESNFKVVLATPLSDNIEAASCIEIEGYLSLVLRSAQAKATELIVAVISQDGAKDEAPDVDSEVMSFPYDHDTMVFRWGQLSANLTSGSAIVSMIPSSRANSKVVNEQDMYVQPGTNFSVPVYKQSPSIASPPPTSALQLKNNNVYSMLSEGVASTASAGLTFETWLKVNEVTESVLVAYTSERRARSEGATAEQQTFVLMIPAWSNSQDGRYDLAANANGIVFSIKDEILKKGQWLHLACSLRNVLALGLSGTSHIDFGNASQFNVQDFSLAFTIQLKEAVGQQQILFTKASSGSDATPIQVEITHDQRLLLVFWAEDEGSSGDAKPKRRTVQSPADDASKLNIGHTYKILISRKLETIQRTSGKPRQAQCVTMVAWRADDSKKFEILPHTVKELEDAENSNKSLLAADSAAQACGSVATNEANLYLGGAPWTGNGLHGIIGPVRFYSTKIKVPSTVSELVNLSDTDHKLIANWSFSRNDTTAVYDEASNNDGKLRGNPQWTISPFAPDHQMVVYLNGMLKPLSHADNPRALSTPAGPHQLTLGNTLHGTGQHFRFQYMTNGFQGEFDELRIWETPRTRQNICDAMYAKISEIPPELAVYLPFDVEQVDELDNDTTGAEILLDNSMNCWHLTPLHEAPINKVVSQAYVGRDAICVRHVHGNMETDDRGADTFSSPSATEYGTMSTDANSSLEGSYKRAYSYIDTNNRWRLDTGFKIGAVSVQWVSQVQTSPTLIGYIEGAPPLPLENYIDEKHAPTSSIKFSNSSSVQYSYGLRKETATDFSMNMTSGIGGKWDVSAGVGVQTEVSSGRIKAGPKTSLDISNAEFKNNFVTMKKHTNLDMKMEVFGPWNENRKAYELPNTGLALVESEVADVFALRLKMRGPVSPLIAYQMRPNPDIPKDCNLIAFEIDPHYTKQGCLNGLHGLDRDPDYPPMAQAPKDASYFKPAEAYALKEKIRRAEEKLAGEHERYSIADKSRKSLPSRAHRNICNSYVWTSDGGTFQETHSTMDFVQHEVGGNNSIRAGIGATLEMEMSVGCFLSSVNVDALSSSYVNVMQTKDQQTEDGFELIAELPQPINIRTKEVGGKMVKRDGAVDTYRWMSFWLEPSVEGTDAFFKQVVNPLWLQDTTIPDAAVMRELDSSLKMQTGNARTKAWRLFHRVTYVNRIIPPTSTVPVATATMKENADSALLADVSCNWLMIQRLEPRVRGAKTYKEMALLAEKEVKEQYPTVWADSRVHQQLLDLLAAYIGVK